jgi:hypothetical protein
MVKVEGLVVRYCKQVNVSFTGAPKDFIRMASLAMNV